MAKLGRDKVALFLACTSILGGKIQAMDANKAKTPQTVAAVGGATSRNNQSKQGLSKNQKLGVITAASFVVASVVGFTIWGVKHHNRLNNKKLLEDAIAFLNSNPSIVSIPGGEFENYNQAVNVFKNCLQLFKDGRMDELEKLKFEIEICGSNIIIKNSTDDGIYKFIISKINNGNYNVKKYIIKDGKEALGNDVELGVGKSKTNEYDNGNKIIGIKSQNENFNFIKSIESELALYEQRLNALKDQTKNFSLNSKNPNYDQDEENI